MAGSYPDVPGRRMAWDGDGSVLTMRLSADGGATYGEVQDHGGSRAEINDEDSVDSIGGGVSGSARIVAVFFPELREFDGFFARTSTASRIDVLQTSGNTTNGIDGTWTTESADYPDTGVSVLDLYRSSITAFARSNVRAVRMAWASNTAPLRAMHIYGDITPGETPDRLLFIDEATGLEFTAAKDWGNVPRGGSEDLEWRIHNNSATLTATTIQYSAEALYLGSAAWYTHTLPAGATFQATRQVASLAPATTSGLILTRRITPAGETLGPHAARLLLNVASWA
jgi:hypothetical protein